MGQRGEIDSGEEMVTGSEDTSMKIGGLNIPLVPVSIGAIFIFCVGLYHILLSNYFLNDDFGRIIWLTPLQEMGTLDALISLFANSYHPVYYRPFTNLVFYVLRQVVGLNAEYYYLSSIILHFATCVAFFHLVRELAGPEKMKGGIFSIIATLLFAVNPRHVEAVSYIHDNENVICGLFFLLGLFLFIRYCKNQRGIYLVCTAISYVFSLFGKEMGVTLPLVCFAYYVLFILEDISIKEIYHDRVMRKSVGAFASVMMCYMMLRYNGLGMLIGGGGFTGELDFSVLRMLRTCLQSIIAMGLPIRQKKKKIEVDSEEIKEGIEDTVEEMQDEDKTDAASIDEVTMASDIEENKEETSKKEEETPEEKSFKMVDAEEVKADEESVTEDTAEEMQDEDKADETPIDELKTASDIEDNKGEKSEEETPERGGEA